jgi:hypothetical protein
MGLGLGTAFGIGAGADLLGSLLGHKGRKQAQDLFDISLNNLRGIRNKPVMDIGAIQSANRGAMMPVARRAEKELSGRYNIDQPRIRKHLMDRLYDQEAMMLPGQMQTSQLEQSGREERVLSLLAKLRAMQLGG